MTPITIRKNIVLKLIMMPLLACLSGCIYLIVGGVGALGGYYVSPDTFEGVVAYDSESVWESVVDVVSVLGLIEEKRDDLGILTAKVNGADVTIKMESLSDESVKLSVKARKFKFPRVVLAQDIYEKIMLQLTE